MRVLLLYIKLILVLLDLNVEIIDQLSGLFNFGSNVFLRDSLYFFKFFVDSGLELALKDDVEVVESYEVKLNARDVLDDLSRRAIQELV